MNCTEQKFKKHVKVFADWLTARGAQVLQPTNEWEVCRFITNKGTSIIYRKKCGTLTFVGEAAKAYDAFLHSKEWRAAPATKRKAKSSPAIRTIRERDGDGCFFCHELVEVEDESVEHLVPITHGGPDHIANMVLAHKKPCNEKAGHLSVMEKIRLREKNALRIEGRPLEIKTAPWEDLPNEVRRAD